MQAVVKTVVYSFRHRLGPGQVGREVFYIVLIDIDVIFTIFDFCVLIRCEASKKNIVHEVLDF